ncbi:MAG: Fic family protein [Nanoarchaeota archaeon]|nr:Fic family protein [Nanoarchaeota archaeon]
MVEIKKKKIGKRTYYYLVHSVRRNGKVKKVEKYLGTKIPRNINKLKKEFLIGILRKEWYPILEKIKKNYLKEEMKLPKSAKEKELLNFAIRFTYDSQKIEGSTLTLRETANLLEKGILPSKQIRDIKETQAHQKIFYEMINYKKDISLQIIIKWHRELFKESKPDIAGKIRETQVKIAGSKFVPPLPVEVYLLLKEFFRWYNKNKNKVNPVELAALAHLKLVTIHPFYDGNGRISRLVMNFILNKNKYPMMITPYENRNSYYNALEKSQIKKDETIFLRWFFKKYVKEYKSYLERIASV